MEKLNLAYKYPNKIEFEVDYIVYHYDNFKFYLKRVDITDIFVYGFTYRR